MHVWLTEAVSHIIITQVWISVMRTPGRNDTKCKGEHENNIVNGICKATALSQIHFVSAFEKRKDDIEMNVNSPQTYIPTFKFIPS